MESNNGALQNIEAQIESCRQLLSVFQEERGFYIQGRSLSKDELASILDRKARLITLFENQRELLKSLELDAKTVSEDVKAKRKLLVRQLASLLEQLIVIDQENERLMREACSTVRRPQALAPFAARQRPALQTQLPLMPFSGSFAPRAVPAAPVAVKPAAPVSVPKLDEAPAAPAFEKAVAAPAQERLAVRDFKAPSVAAGSLPVRPKSHLRVYGSAPRSGAVSANV